ncbi:MAG: PfkB family carbohydrate kinase [Anaerolineae bacterium]|nr:PfkB family carbohydrate kinase [Anaerolineae bacterium]
MQPTNYHTYDEIKSQTEAWAQALEVASASSLPKAGDYDQVIFTGCGSTYYLSLAAAALYQELTGCFARAVPGGELLLNPRAHSFGLTTSLDTNYDPSEKRTGFDELLSVTNVFLPNEKEAVSLSGESNVDLAASRLGSRVEALAIKLGAEGALGVREGTRVRVASIPIKVIDTVGAGDSFDAGFLYGYLNQWDLEKSLQLACVCGALSTQQAGGIDGQPTLEEALSFLK